MSRSRWIVVAGVLAWGAPARAWNPHGHRVVAALAYSKLEPAVERKVASFLKLNPDYPRWVADVSPKDAARAAFLRASNWADDIREKADYADVPAAPHPPGSGYRDKQKHKDWHYTNRPFSTDGTPTRPSPVPNVQTQIAALRRVLASAQSRPEEKSYALVWLLHLVGDVHNPLHCTARFDGQLPQGDRGGTLILLSPDPKDHLHAYWDRLLGDRPDLLGAWADAALISIPPAEMAAITDEDHWVTEGFEAARRWVYVPPVGPGPGPFTLDGRYGGAARIVAGQRVALAGARLARLLDDALK